MSIRKQSIQGVLIKALSIGLSFLVVAILARMLGPTEYGVYSVTLATVTLLTVPTALGLPNYVVREVALAMSDRDGVLTWLIVRSASALVLLVSLLVLSATILFMACSDSRADYQTTIWIGLWLIPLIALIQVLGAALRGIARAKQGLLLGLTLRQMVFAVLLLAWIALFDGLNSVSAVTLHVVAALSALGFGMVCWYMFRPAKTAGKGSAGKVNRRKMLLSTGTMGVIAGSQALNANLDIIMLGALRNAELAGIYTIASTAAMLTVAGLQVINMVMMPHFARVYRERRREELQNLATRAVRMILLTAAPASFLLLVFGRQLIEIVFGAQYLPSYLPMTILVGGQLVSAMLGSVMTLLNMTGHEKDTMKVVLFASAINIVLNAVLIPRFGAEGAAIATATTVVFWNVALHLQIRRRLQVNSAIFRIRTALPIKKDEKA